MTRKLGFIYSLERAAELLDQHANELRAAHTIRNRWPRCDADGAKCAHDEMKRLAKMLRMSAEYHKPNPLGGPAGVFDAVADRIRAGEKMKRVMRDHGLRFKRSNVEHQRVPAGTPLHGPVGPRSEE